MVISNPAPLSRNLVRFEEVAPANKIVAFFDVSLESLAAYLQLIVFEGYDDLDDMRFAYWVLSSGETVVLGRYMNSPLPGTYLFVVDITPETPKLVMEACELLVIMKEEILWIYPDFQEEFDQLCTDAGGLSIQRRPLIEESLWSGVLEPIDAFYHSLTIYKRNEFPEYWAMLQRNLGLAYFHREQGDRRENLEKSIKCFHNSLQVFTPEEFLKGWQLNQDDLAEVQQVLNAMTKLTSSSAFNGLRIALETQYQGVFNFDGLDRQDPATVKVRFFSIDTIGLTLKHAAISLTLETHNQGVFNTRKHAATGLERIIIERISNQDVISNIYISFDELQKLGVKSFVKLMPILEALQRRNLIERLPNDASITYRPSSRLLPTEPPNDTSS